jgi:hypothetical protein
MQPTVEAGAAEGGALSTRATLKSELRRAERAHVAAGAGTEDDDVEGLHD